MNKISSISITAILYFSLNATVHADNCLAMAEMAKDIANIRDLGTPLSYIEQRLRSEVKSPDELALAILVARLVYRTRATGNQLKREVEKNCK